MTRVLQISSEGITNCLDQYSKVNNIINSLEMTEIIVSFYQHFLFIFHTQHHNITSIIFMFFLNNKTKKQTYTQYLKSPVKRGGREGRARKTQNKSFLYIITYVKEKTLPSINGRRLSPINSCCCTFTSHYLQEKSL